MKMVRKKNFGICNSCAHFNYDFGNPQCAMGIDNSSYNRQTKKCKDYDLKQEFVERFAKINLTRSMVNQISQYLKENKNERINPLLAKKLIFQQRSNSVFVPEEKVWLDEYKEEIIHTIKHVILGLLKKRDLYQKDTINPDGEKESKSPTRDPSNKKSCKFPNDLTKYLKQEGICRDFDFIRKKHKSIFSLDIETTSWMPKAHEGYINHITQSCIDLKGKDPVISIFQIINMNRKPDNVKNMLDRVWAYMANPRAIPEAKSSEDSVEPPRFHKTVQLVFNRRFDIKILEKMFKKFTLPHRFPKKRVDLMDQKKSLALLEKYLKEKHGFKRLITEKGNYKDYYARFKKKKIEPISTYNVVDTLTPLLYFISSFT